MYGNNFRSPMVDAHQFSMIPRSDIPRSTYRMQHQHKTTCSAAALIPVLIQEVLPGDTFNVSMTPFVRMATPLYPILDNIEMETFFFFVPNRILWTHWVNFMGEQPASPSDSISYVIPQVVSPAGGFAQNSLYDYMGIPPAGQITGANTVSVNALPFRAYNMIFNQWFRDQNLDTAVGYGASNTVYDLGDGPDPSTNYALRYARKRHDYFSSALPWTQKAASPVTLPLAGTAIVKTNTNVYPFAQLNPNALQFLTTAGGVPNSGAIGLTASNAGDSATAAAAIHTIMPANLYADLTTATASTINQIRLAFQTQRLLERDARGGTRYQELLMSHFGVRPLDSRVQRPEYLGGGKTPVNIAPVPQTTATGLTGGTSPLGTLSAVGLASGGHHGFRGSFTEHGYIIGIMTFRHESLYQQGIHRMWTRSTRYDFYWPVFAMLGEQGIRNDEIYATGTATDTQVFGYQERWAEYRYYPSRTSAYFRSTNTTPLDSWHLGTKFASLPSLNSSFMGADTDTNLARGLAAGAAANNQQFLCDLFFDVKAARPLPMYSVPGMLDHF
jgi:Capsid protein (F protein)